MENAFELWKIGKSGSHHVWGKIEIEKKSDYKFIILQHEKYKFLNKIGKLIGIGHLDQQLRAIVKIKEYDLLYAPYSTANTKLLVALKLLKLYRKPIVVTIHQPFLGTNSKYWIIRKLTNKILNTYEHSIFLSEKLLDITKEKLKISSENGKKKISVAQWGPDIDFYKRLSPAPPLEECNYAISAGHTSRDYETLILAFEKLNIPLKIFCTPESVPKLKFIPENVTINSKKIPYLELLNHYIHSRIILTPLKYKKVNEGCQGMTSLQDVVALGKPTLMTKNQTLNLDIEEEGFGKYIPMGDIDKWVEELNLIWCDFPKLNRMRENALKTYFEKFNSENYSEHLYQVFETIRENDLKKTELSPNTTLRS